MYKDQFYFLNLIIIEIIINLIKTFRFQIQWLFNDRPVHGKDFLVSVSGDRQVLTIPETESTHAGIISCVAENAAGKATCSARLEIGKSHICMYSNKLTN